MLKIPTGQSRVLCERCYLNHIGKPKAVRVVANAVGSNPIPFIIPCHRAIRKVGEFGGYAGLANCKNDLQGKEVYESHSLCDRQVAAEM